MLFEGGDVARVQIARGAHLHEDVVIPQFRAQGALPGITFFCTKASSAAINVAVGILLDVVRFPVGARVADVPVEKVRQLALFTVVVVTLAAVLLVWVISRYDISAAKQARINERLRELRAPPSASARAASGAAAAAGTGLQAS